VGVDEESDSDDAASCPVLIESQKASLVNARMKFLGAFCLLIFPIHAERLPVRAFSVADGLPSNSATCVVRDSQNFLWFCTPEGLARFDGYSFSNYQIEQGLPDRTVVAFLQTKDGEYWVATAHSIARFHPEAAHSRLFEVYRPPDFQPLQSSDLIEGPGACLYYLTGNKLLLFDRRTKRFETVDIHYKTGALDAVFRDRDGSIWIGGEFTLTHRFADGRIDEFGIADGLPSKGAFFRVTDFLRDREGHLWLATWRGVLRLVANPTPGRQIVERVYTTQDGLPGDVTFGMFQSHDGRIFAGSEKGLGELIPATGKTPDRFRSYTSRNGFDLPTDGPSVSSFAEDNAGNLWIAGTTPIRIATGGFVHYGMEDGLQTRGVASIFEDREKHLIVVGANPLSAVIHRYREGRFYGTVPWVPKGVDFPWGSVQIHLQDHEGAWWVSTSSGLYRYQKGLPLEDVAHTKPLRIYSQRNGLPGDQIFRIFEDSRGDIWISVIGSEGVWRWSRAREAIEGLRFDDRRNVLGTPTVFAEDRSGAVWAGFYMGGLARYDGHDFHLYTEPDGIPGGGVRAIYIDHFQRIWLATSRGLARLQYSAGAPLQGKLYTTRDGLLTDVVSCLTEDSLGRIYAGSSHGIDQITPQSGRVRHYSRADGLDVMGDAAIAYRDHDGVLWFGKDGVSRFVPGPDDPAQKAPPIRLTRIAVQGKDQAMSELGETQMSGLRLPAGETPLEISFASINFIAGEIVRYQYRLRGSEWSETSDVQRVTYASLSPGSYRFEVRAVNSDGRVSDSPALLAFTVLPPWWRTWRFFTLLVAALSIGILALHRYRLRQALELERVRTRIATDLHDDIGSSLTQIAILSELAQRSASAAAETVHPLSRIADLSRELVDSMSDIVWAINPQRDHLRDLSYRMRRFASDVFTSKQIHFKFTPPAPEVDVNLSATVRRQIFLIFKESVNNLVRHSQTNRAEIELRIENGRLSLLVRDHGQGFSVPANATGHGISSMQQRAAGLGGEFNLVSEPGHGTTVTLSMTLDRRSRRTLRTTH